MSKNYRDPQAEQSLLVYLRETSRLMGDRSLFGFVKKQGQLYKPALLPENVRRGKPRVCFTNALHLAQRRDDLTYVEGFGTAVIPTLHAWCVDKNGTVIDPTWDEPDKCAYYGIPFKLDFALRTVIDNGFYGMLSDPETAGKLFSMLPSLYREGA